MWRPGSNNRKRTGSFTGSKRDIELNGEAYFAVHPDRRKPFIVHTPFDIRAEVLGTEFNMEAYETEREVKTTLVSDSVRLTFQTDKKEEKSYLLKPDEEMAAQRWILTAFSEYPHRVFTVMFCLIHLKNTSISHRWRKDG